MAGWWTNEGRQERDLRRIRSYEDSKLRKVHAHMRKWRGVGRKGMRYDQLYRMTHAEMIRRGLNPPEDTRYI